MTEKLPRVTADQAIRAISKLGFKLVRQSGSHKIYRNAEGIRMTIPYHRTKILHPKLIKAILQDTHLSPEDFLELL